MADYQKIVELRPEMADFLENRRKIGIRGDVLTYWPNSGNDSFTTDSAGFRHSTLGGQTYSLSDCLHSESYGIVLGASNLFGFGVAGNENCLPSLLAERFGFPFANAALPGGNSRNLHSLLLGLLVGTRQAPAVVVHSNGGDLAGFCESSLCDPIFGSPNRSQMKSIQEDGGSADPERNFPNLPTFSAMWTSAVARLCRRRGIPFVMLHQATAFEKTSLSPLEQECRLGEAVHPSQQTQFANHRKYNEPFYEKRTALANALGVPLAGAPVDKISFIDEFHCDKDGFQVVAKAVGDTIEQLLGSDPAGGKANAPAAAPASA